MAGDTTDEDDEGSEIYRMTKGVVLIINNENFDHPDPRKKREGSKEDVIAIKTACERLGLDTELRQNLKAEDMKTVIQSLQKETILGMTSVC